MQELADFMSGFFSAVWDLLGVPLIFGFTAQQFIIFGVVASLSVGIFRLIFGIGEGLPSGVARVGKGIGIWRSKE